jgi:hypothetical protein
MAGARPPAGALRASLTRVAARLTTPVAYLAILGGLQVLLLWVLREHVGLWPALAGTVGWIGLLALLIWTTGRWRLKLLGIAGLGVVTAIAPTLVAIVERPRIGLTMEHDGLLQLESAIDRVLQGQPIYGVDWSNTPMANVGWQLTPGQNPALHHLAYYPLTVLVGVPVRLLTDAWHLPFDYRLVLIGFALLGLMAIAALPIGAERRFMIITAIFVSPLITLYLWAGRNDIEFLTVLFLCLVLLARGHVILAAGALGAAVALKPFALIAVPFLLLVLIIRWRANRSGRDLALALLALGAVPAATMLPFFLANPGAFWTDVVLYTSGGIPDAYPIRGYGFGEILYGLHVIGRRTDSFPFAIFEVAAAAPVLWIAGRAFLQRPTGARWMAGYALLLLAFTFFARFFNDNYAAVVVTLLLCVLPLGSLTVAPASPDRAVRRAA